MKNLIRVYVILFQIALIISLGSLDPLSAQTVTDYDGNTYATIEIGNQIWMAENLRSIHYSDGVPVQSYVYNNDTSNVSVYGRLYRWSAAMRNASSSNTIPSGIQGACPDEWHLPSNAEWQDLINHLGGESVAGGKLKEEGFLHWQNPNTGATNESEFSAIATGWFDFTNVYKGIGESCFLRTSTAPNSNVVYTRILTNTSASITSGNIHPDDAIPVRCIKDNLTGINNHINKDTTKVILNDNYPNPFKKYTTIEYTIAKPSHVLLKIFNSHGRHVKTLINNNMPPGTFKTTWNLKDDLNQNVNTGLYYYEITCDTGTDIKQMIYIK